MRAFDFAAYTKNPATIAPAVSLVAKVWLDGDTYVVIPDPENELSAFRFAKGDVHVVDVLPPEPGAAAIAEPLYEIAVRHNAPCIKLSVGAVEQYWNALSEPQADDEWSGEVGLITEVVQRQAPSCAGLEAYMCGPTPMIDAAIALLTRAGMKESEIFYDKFVTKADTGG